MLQNNQIMEFRSANKVVFGPNSAASVANEVTILGGLAILYTPAPDFVGDDRFTYTVGDGTGLDAEGTVLRRHEGPFPDRAAVEDAVNKAAGDFMINATVYRIKESGKSGYLVVGDVIETIKGGY